MNPPTHFILSILFILSKKSEFRSHNQSYLEIGVIESVDTKLAGHKLPA